MKNSLEAIEHHDLWSKKTHWLDGARSEYSGPLWCFCKRTPLVSYDNAVASWTFSKADDPMDNEVTRRGSFVGYAIEPVD